MASTLRRQERRRKDRPISKPRFVATSPPADIPVPRQVQEAAGNDKIIPVWSNQLGGLTFKLVGDSSVRFAKFSPLHSAKPDTKALDLQELDMRHEVERLEWASRYVRVPQVLGFDEFDDGQLLVTAALPGVSLVTEFGRDHPEEAARVLGAGLRELHAKLPVQQCPFEWSLASRTAQLPHDVREHFLAEAREEDLVVCHGDPCAPNTLFNESFQLVGHVDLGTMGVGDRWADLSVAALSTIWNFGYGYEHCVYEGYGIDPDEQKIDFYRRLWDAT